MRNCPSALFSYLEVLYLTKNLLESSLCASHEFLDSVWMVLLQVHLNTEQANGVILLNTRSDTPEVLFGYVPVQLSLHLSALVFKI